MKDNRTKICRTCRESFSPRPIASVFCSETCRIAWKATQNSLPPEPKLMVCNYCQKEFVAKTRHPRKYCSQKCQQAAYREKIVKGISNSEPYKLRFSILARDGFRCRYCGRTPQEEGIKLNVDHIVPKDKGGNDDPSNLISCCQDCNLGKGTLLLLSRKGQIPSYLTIESIMKLPRQ